MMKHFLAKAVTGISLCIGMCALLLGASEFSAYAANNSELDTTSTKAEVQEAVEDGTFDYTKLSTDVIQHIYSLYDNDPETIRALQRQSDSAHSSSSSASLATTYTHSSLFKKYKVLNGIDVSTWNGDINWKKVKASGVDFVFIRAGGRYTISGAYFTDSKFKQNIKGAISAGLDVGVYFFSAAISTSEAKKEAAYVMKLVSGYNINLPIVMDYEYDSGPSGRLYDAHLSKSAATKVVKAFCAAVEKKGYTGMIYASKSVLAGDMYAATIAKSYPVWTAQYNNTDTLTSAHSYWQYTSSGTVPGIEHATDLNFRYIKSPAKAKSLVQASSTDTSITLKWNKIPEVYGYQIYRYNASKNKYVYIGKVKGSNTLTYTDKGLADGKQYKYKVRGYYKLKSGNKYGAFSDVTTGITVTDDIKNFKIKASASDSIKLSWSSIPVVTGYQIYRYDSSSKKYKSIATIEGSDISSYTDSGLLAGTKYSYKVRAYTKTDTDTIWHTFSAIRRATTLPGKVSGLKKAHSSSSTLQLSWNKQTNVDGYIVYRWDDSASSWKRVAKLTGADKNSYTHKGLKAGCKYTYSVKAYYKKSGKLKYTTRSDSAFAYTGPSASASIWVKSRSADSIRLAWNSVKDAAGYIVYKYDTKSKKYKSVGKITDSSTCVYTVTGLKATTTYKLAVIAYLEKDGIVGYSTRTTLDTCTAPAKPASFKCKSLGSRTYLKWKKVSGATGYIVYKYDTTNNTYTQVKKLTDSGQTSYIGPKLSSKYEYRVRVYKRYNGKTHYGAMSDSPQKYTGTIYGIVNDTSVRVRKGAGTSHSIVTELSRGQKVKIIGSKTKKGVVWYKVSFTRNGRKTTGYMSSKYIKLK